MGDKPSSVMDAINPSIGETEAGQSLEFEASLLYTVTSRTTRATQRYPVLKNQKKRGERDSEGRLVERW